MRDTREMAKKPKFGLPLAGIFVLLAIFLPACKSSTDTNTRHQHDNLSSQDRGQQHLRTNPGDLHGRDQPVHPDQREPDDKIADVSIATHTMEARIPGGALIDTTEIDVTQQTDYSYSIDRPDINIVNGWGEPLKIYLGDVYQFTLADDENRWLIAVPLASHFLKATRVSDNSEVASITINVTQNKDYSWTIS